MIDPSDSVTASSPSQTVPISSDVMNIVSVASLTHFRSVVSAIADEGFARNVTSTIGGTSFFEGEYVAV